MHHHRSWLSTITVAAVATAGLGLTGPAAAGQAAPAGQIVTNLSFDAASFGSKTTGNPNADSDATALSHLPCTRVIPKEDSNFATRTGDGDDVTLQNVRTRNFTKRANGQKVAVSLVKIDKGTFANGQAGFENLTGRVRISRDGSGFDIKTVSDLGQFTLAGVPIDIPRGQETEILVPGQGKIIFNRVVKHNKLRRASAAVNVIRFVRDDGTIEKIGRAFARISKGASAGLFGGAAWGSDASTGGVADAGRAALQPMPCPGTHGRILESSTGESDTDFGFLGARRSFVYGVQRSDSATGYTRAVVESAKFGAGALEFRNIRARANVTRQRDGDVVRNAKGTGVEQILIAGEEVQPPPAGEEQRVQGVGSFTVRVVDKTRRGIDVTGVIVRLFNGTAKDRTDDTIVNLARAKLRIQNGSL